MLVMSMWKYRMEFSAPLHFTWCKKVAVVLERAEVRKGICVQRTHFMQIFDFVRFPYAVNVDRLASDGKLERIRRWLDQVGLEVSCCSAEVETAFWRFWMIERIIVSIAYDDNVDVWRVDLVRPDSGSFPIETSTSVSKCYPKSRKYFQKEQWVKRKSGGSDQCSGLDGWRCGAVETRKYRVMECSWSLQFDDNLTQCKSGLELR